MKKALFLLFTFGAVTVSANDTMLVSDIAEIAIKQGKRVQIISLKSNEVVIKLKDVNDLNLENIEEEFSQYTCAVF